MNEVPRVTRILMLKALNDHPVYAGTVSAKDKAKRRRRNKAARLSRRANRA